MTRRLTILATRQEITLNTQFVYPPIPIRNFDWFACNDDAYDYGEPKGEGRTEMDAVNALLDELEAQ
jgi:hypothetical protein